MIITIQKIKSSSLVETLVAMTIIVTVMTMAITVFVKVTTSGTTGVKVKAAVEAQNLAERTRQMKSFFDEEYELEGLLVKKVVLPYQGNESILLVNITVSQGDKLVTSYKELISAP